MDEKQSIPESGIIENNKLPKSKKTLIIILIILLLVVAGGLIYFFVYKKETSQNNNSPKDIKEPENVSYNALENFDIKFLKLENKEENIIYSPLSISYGLNMIKEASEGNTKNQIEKVVPSNKLTKYTNSKNMSLANAVVINQNNKKDIKQDYINNLQNNYNAEVIFDSFKTTEALNAWVNNKTLSLINNLFEEVSEDDVFVLVNALAIDMEWEKVIQNINNPFEVAYDHEVYKQKILALSENGYAETTFNNSKKVNSVLFGASINKYDIVSILGEQNIRKTVGKAYDEWLAEGGCGEGTDLDTASYLNQYISEIDKGYERIDSSTDFSFYENENVKAFSKALKEYDGINLEYIAIMPKKTSLTSYINRLNAEDVNSIIVNLKEIKLDNFK